MSYAIYFDETLVSGGESPFEIGFTDTRLHLVENGAGEFSFVIPPGNIYYDVPAEKKTEVRFYLFYDDPAPTFAGFVSNIKYDFWMRKHVTVEGDLALLRNTIHRPVDLSGKTVREFLTEVITNHNTGVGTAAKKKFTVGTVDYTGKVTEGVINYDTTANIVEKKLLDERAGIMAVRYTQSGTALTKYLDYTKETNAPRATQTIELGQNIIDFEIDMQGDDIVTCVIPLGAKLEDKDRPAGAIEGVDYYVDITSVNDGNDYIIAPSTVTSKFGRIWKVLHFDDVKKPSRVKTLGENYLSNYQFINMIIKIKAVDLALAFGTYEPLKLSYIVQVKSSYHGMNAEFRITEMDIFPDEPEKNTVTCGHSGIHTLSSMIAGATGNRYRLDATGVSFTPNPDTSGGGTGSDSGGGSGGNTGGGDTGGGDTGGGTGGTETAAVIRAHATRTGDYFDMYAVGTGLQTGCTVGLEWSTDGATWSQSTREKTVTFESDKNALQIRITVATYTNYRYKATVKDSTGATLAVIKTAATVGNYTRGYWYVVSKNTDGEFVANVTTTTNPFA